MGRWQGGRGREVLPPIRGGGGVGWGCVGGGGVGGFRGGMAGRGGCLALTQGSHISVPARKKAFRTLSAVASPSLCPAESSRLFVTLRSPGRRAEPRMQGAEDEDRGGRQTGAVPPPPFADPPWNLSPWLLG